MINKNIRVSGISECKLRKQQNVITEIRILNHNKIYKKPSGAVAH